MYIPYAGFGDPAGLTGSVDSIETGSVAAVGTYVPYAGFGDPAGLTASVDSIETGSIGDAPRVDVEAFCEGEGRELAERNYVGFCHLANDLK
jgi:hypothetical protein